MTLLALFTGLAAQLAPTQARAERVSEVGVAVEAAEIHVPVSRPNCSINIPSPSLGQCTLAAVMLRCIRNCIPAVMLGIDRARE